MLFPTTDVRLREWETKELPGVELTDEGRRLAARLNDRSGPGLEILELADGIRVRTTSWVGVIQFGDVRITVEPKLAGQHLKLTKLLEWTSGIDALRSVRSTVGIDFDGDDLFDLLARLLVTETERLIRGGLRSAYVEKQEALPVLKGRLDIDRQIRRRQGRIELLECRFDDRSTDIADNQLLLAAIDRCTPKIRNSVLRRRAGRVRVILSELCSPGWSDLAEEPMRYNRLNDHYRAGHHWARTILRGSHGLESFFRPGSGRCFAFFLDMNRLFEQFVERALTEIFGDDELDLHFQRRHGSIVRRSGGGPYKNLIPDTVLEIPSEAIHLPIDAKYKRYSENTLDPGDVAQTFLYSFGLWDPAAGQTRYGMIVYPSETNSVDAEWIHIREPSGKKLAEMAILGLPVSRLLDELDQSSGETPLSAEVRESVLKAASAM